LFHTFIRHVIAKIRQQFSFSALLQLTTASFAGPPAGEKDHFGKKRDTILPSTVSGGVLRDAILPSKNFLVNFVTRFALRSR